MPDYPEALTHSLRTLSRFLVGDESVGQTLQRVAELATDAIDGAEFAGLTLDSENGPRTAVFTDSESPEIDEAQYDAGTGPCLDAMRMGTISRIDSNEDDDRWPAFSRKALEHGIRSSLSLPLNVGGKGIGALNLYSRRKNAFVGAEEYGTAFAEQAAVILANAQAYSGAFELSQQMQMALTSRAVIDQAKGILMAAQACTADEAFDLLRSASQRTNVKLRDVAEAIVERAQSRPKVSS